MFDVCIRGSYLNFAHEGTRISTKRRKGTAAEFETGVGIQLLVRLKGWIGGSAGYKVTDCT